MTPIGVVGLSHLGIVASACLAAEGLDVIGVDADGALVTALTAGRPPLHEPGLEGLLAQRAPRFTTDHAALRECGLVILAADTVTDERNRSDLAALEAHVDRALLFLRADGVVALMSQVPVGYTRQLGARLRAHRSDFRGRLYYWVETLVVGEAIERYRRPERIVIGGPAEPVDPDAVLDPLLERFRCPVLRMSYENAEMLKAAVNFYLATSVAVANTLADLCEATGASMRTLRPALHADRRIGPFAYLRPGLGLGGGNLERDLVHLREIAETHAVDARLLDDVLDLSAARFGWLARAVDHHLLGGPPRPRVAVWGLAYKKNTASTKNSTALWLIRHLASRATIAAYDPRAVLPEPREGVEVAPSAAAALLGAAGLVILTDWDEFAAADLTAVRKALACPVVIDAVGVLDPAQARAAGITYVGIGEG